MELIIDHVSQNITIVWDSGRFQVGKHIHTGKMRNPNSTRIETPVLGVPRPCPKVPLYLAVHLYPLLNYLLDW